MRLDISNKSKGTWLAGSLMAALAAFMANTPCHAEDFDSYQFYESNVAGLPLYHASIHIHFKEPYNPGPNAPYFPQRDWYIGGLLHFQRGELRGPIDTASLRTDHPARVLGVQETEMGSRKPINHKLASALVDSAIYLKQWLPEQRFPYFPLPTQGIGINSNSVVRAILVKNNAYGLWKDVHYKHIAPGMEKDGPGIPGYDAVPLKSAMVGEQIYCGVFGVIFSALLTLMSFTRLGKSRADKIPREARLRRNPVADREKQTAQTRP